MGVEVLNCLRINCTNNHVFNLVLHLLPARRGQLRGAGKKIQTLARRKK